MNIYDCFVVTCVPKCFDIFQRIENKTVYFVNGEAAEFDTIILCTGYKINLPFLSENVKNTILNESNNDLKVQ